MTTQNSIQSLGTEGFLSDQQQRLILPVRGMTCAGCAATIERRLKELAGVVTASVGLEAGIAHIIYIPAQIHRAQMVQVITAAGYTVPPTGESAAAASTLHSRTASNLLRPIAFGVLGSLALLLLYLGLVSWAEGWTHAVELLLEDAWIVGPILLGFGIQVGLYTYLKTGIHVAGRGAGAMTGAGGGTSTVAMVACCAHHVTDVLPLLGLSVAATFLAEYRIPFMMVGLLTNLIGIGLMVRIVWREKQRAAAIAAHPQADGPVCH